MIGDEKCEIICFSGGCFLFGIHGVSVTLLEVVNIFKLCWINLSIFLEYMECPKKCSICKLSIFLDNAASICQYFWNTWGVCDIVMDITRFCFVWVCDVVMNITAPWTILWRCYGYNKNLSCWFPKECTHWNFVDICDIVMDITTFVFVISKAG